MADLIDRDEVKRELNAQYAVAKNTANPDAVEQILREVSKFFDSFPAVNRWISVEDALPEQDGEYLVFTEYEDVFKCTFDSEEENKWGFEQDYRDPDTLGWAGTTWTAVETVTHWMPLPEPPEKE